MRAIVILILLSSLIAAGPVAAWEWNGVQSGITFLFDRSQQEHPKKAVVAIPITGQLNGENGGRLCFEGVYMTRFWAAEDSRNGQGKVIMKVKVLRGDQVVWKKKKRDKVEYDRETGWQCGNCTHKLKVCRKFDGGLQNGDLVLFNLTFRGLPVFNDGEVAVVEAYISPPDRQF
jgi:hypothetical protein